MNAERIQNDAVFLSEVDCDVFSVPTEETLFRSLVAYLLLGRTVLVHPLYVWQSPRAYSMFIGSKSAVLEPPYVKLILDETTKETVTRYASARIEKLEEEASRFSYDFRELANYRNHPPAHVQRDAGLLDARFCQSGGLYTLQQKDRRFREMIRHELTRKTYSGNHLYALLWPHRTQAGYSEPQLDRVVDSVLELAADSRRVVCCDSLVATLTGFGFTPDSLRRFYGRLRYLMIKSHDDGIVCVPTPVGELPDDQVDPYNPGFFWTVMRVMLGGSRADALLSLNWEDQVRVAVDLARDRTWRRFTQEYVDVVREAHRAGTHLDQVRIAKRLLHQYPHGPFHFSSLLSAQEKWKMLSLMLTCASGGLIAWVKTFPSFASVSSIVSLTVSSVGIATLLARHAGQYLNSDNARLRRTLSDTIAEYSKR